MMIDYDYYMQSKEWFIKKKDIYNRADGKCERCGSTFRPQVHHLSYANLGNEKDNDLVLLCSKCHIVTHICKGGGRPTL
jgi:5-methylcytosine-specific restriction endonuclease McrA